MVFTSPGAKTRLMWSSGRLYITLLALLFLVPYTLSRFKSEARGDARIDYAFFVVSDTYNHQSITLTDMKPGDSNSYWGY